MPLLTAKLLSADSLTELQAAVAAYKAGDGSELVDTQRAMAADMFVETDGDNRSALCLFHGGADIPASGAKTADLQHIVVSAKGTVAECQAAIDDALALVEQSSVSDGDLDNTPNDIETATGLFEAEDVGRKVDIGGEIREITAYTSANAVTYDGEALTGTSVDIKLLGAEVIQDAVMTMQKDKAAGGHRLQLIMACEGEAY